MVGEMADRPAVDHQIAREEVAADRARGRVFAADEHVVDPLLVLSQRAVGAPARLGAAARLGVGGADRKPRVDEGSGSHRRRERAHEEIVVRRGVAAVDQGTPDVEVAEHEDRIGRPLQRAPDERRELLDLGAADLPVLVARLQMGDEHVDRLARAAREARVQRALGREHVLLGSGPVGPAALGHDRQAARERELVADQRQP